ncbi:hypothetical protein ACIOFV_52215, partial [Streptomyces mirabilis]
NASTTTKPSPSLPVPSPSSLPQLDRLTPSDVWSDWYAAYIVARENGRAPDEAADDAALHMESLGR